MKTKSFVAMIGLWLMCAIPQVFAQTGTVTWEIWQGFTQSFDNLKAYTTANAPTSTFTLSAGLNTVSGYGDNYGSRVKGYIVPQTSGNYRFHINSDDDSQLYLSTDEKPENLVSVVRLTGCCNEVTSASFYALEAGISYYFEYYHKEGTGGDYATVRWTRPDATKEIIPAARLSETPVIVPDMKRIVSFVFDGLSLPAYTTIDEGAKTITVEVSSGTDVSNLTPTVLTNYGATVSPLSGVAQNFTNPVVYTVTANDASTVDYTVTVNVLPLQTDNTVARFYVKQLNQEAVIDNGSNTITITHYKGYTKAQTVTVETGRWSTSSIVTGATLQVTDLPVNLMVTAQDGSQRTYTIQANIIEGTRGFSDGFATDANIGTGKMWANESGYVMTHNATDQNLQIQCPNSNWQRTTNPLPVELNLYGYPLVRFRAKASTTVFNNNLKLIDANGKKNDHWSNANTKFTINGSSWQEFYIDFTGKLFWDDKVNEVELGRITGLHYDATDGLTNALINFDDIRLGVDAVLNSAPTINAVAKPKYIYLTDGAQTINLTGITDGNPERTETVTISATSSDPAIVGSISVNSYDALAGTAQLHYSPAGVNGFAIVTVYVQDDRGTLFTGETDMDSIKVIIEVRDPDPDANNATTFGLPVETTFFTNTGQNVVLIPNVDDGDLTKVQGIRFAATSGNTNVVTIDSVAYTPGSHIALLYIKEKGLAGTSSITLSAQDEEDYQAGGTNIFEVSFPVTITGIDKPGVHYQTLDYAHWQEMPYGQTPPVVGDYLLTTTEANDLDKRDFFWSKMYGYITAPVSGEYIFEVEDHEGAYFFLSTDYQKTNIPGKTSPTAKKNSEGTVNSVPITLEAGKTYYFEAYFCEIVFGYIHRIWWTGPNFARTLITAPHLTSDLDIQLPTAPANLAIITTGVTDVTGGWEAATDDGMVKGYQFYVDGLAVNSSLIAGLEYQAGGLESETEYTITVRAVDAFDNLSAPATPITFTTYAVDNNPPTVPQNLSQTDATGESVELTWTASTDNETEVRGYNIYIDGEATPVNTEIIRSTSYFVTGLSQITDYDFRVSAVDAAYNESAKSDLVTASTTKFCPTCNQDGLKRARVSISTTPVATNSGLGIQVDYGTGAILKANKAVYSYFENTGLSNTTLGNYGMEKSSGMTLSIETATGYDNSRSAKLSGGTGDYLRTKAETTVDPSFEYLVKFRMKKSPTYTGNVTVKVFATFVADLHTTSFTPTDSWEEYSFTFTPAYSGGQGSWMIEFKLGATGTIYLDNVEFFNNNFYDGSTMTTIGKELIEEFQPSGIRWGGIGANYENLAPSTGKYLDKGLSYADIAKLSKDVGAVALYSIGVNAASDWYTNANTMKNFIDYLGADAGNPWGAKREAEGYGELIQSGNGIVVELGNEVWGGSAHGAELFDSKPTEYGTWARSKALNMKTSSFYTPDKVFTAYSGRHMNNLWGWNPDVIKNDVGEVDWLSVSGYMGGNLGYTPTVDPGKTELDYHKNAYQNFSDQIYGIDMLRTEMLRGAGRIMPMYAYEGNMTTEAYNGRLGQAITFTDFYATFIENGGLLPVVFILDGGQWRLIDDRINYKKLPQFYTGALFNQHTKGIILKTTVESSEIVKAASGLTLPNITPVGAHAYTNDTTFTVALFSRDFENDYLVQVDIPDGINERAGAFVYTLSGESFNSKDVTIETDTITDFADSLMVNVPKHGMVIVKFYADDQNLTAPMANLDYKKVDSIEVYTLEGVDYIDVDGKYLRFAARVFPSDAVYKNVSWSIVENSANSFWNSGALRLYGKSNGTTVVKATALDGSGVSDTMLITISNQVTAVEEVTGTGAVIYPNPATSSITIEIGEGTAGTLKLFNTSGTLVSTEALTQKANTLSTDQLPKGLYYLRLELNTGIESHKLVIE